MRSCLVLLLAAGCYATIIQPPGAVRAGPEHSDRQWFTAGGFVPLSSPSGAECGPAGLAYVRAEVGWTDIVISGALAFAGSFLGAALCPLDDMPSKDDARNYAACASIVGSLLPALISTRTVSYACNAPPAPR